MLGARTTLVASLSLAAASFACAPPRQCYAQNDCPEGQGCTADGRCLAESPEVALADARGSRWGGTSSSPSAPAADGVGDASTPGTMSGTLGPLELAQAPMTSAPANGNFTATAPGQGADALLIFSTAQQLDLTTPGTHHYDANDMSSPVMARACTTNESPAVQHFDEPSSVDVTVNADRSVDFTFTGDQLHMTASFASQVL